MAAAVAAVGTGCSADAEGADGADGKDHAGPAAAVPPGAAEQAQALRDSTDLLGRYDAAAAAHPSLAARLAPLRAEIARHVEAFGGTPPTAGTKAPAADGATTPKLALAALATAERKLADSRAAALLTVPGGLARLLASVAAAGAGHAALLGGGPGADGGTSKSGHEG